MILILTAESKFDDKPIQRSGGCSRARPQWTQHIVDFGDEFIRHGFQWASIPVCVAAKEGLFGEDQVWVAYS